MNCAADPSACGSDASSDKFGGLLPHVILLMVCLVGDYHFASAGD